MSSYKEDLGKTKYPLLYVPFNECNSNTTRIPVRIGMSTLAAGANHGEVDSFGHMTFPGTNPSATGTRAYFQDVQTSPWLSRHLEYISPALNVGKHIVMSSIVNISGFTGYKFIYDFTAYGPSGGGMSLETQATGGLRLDAKAKGGTSTNYTNSSGGTIPIGESFNLIWHINVVSSSEMRHTVYAVRANSSDKGTPLISKTYNFEVSDLKGPQIGFGGGTGFPFDIRDFIAVVLPTEEEALQTIDGIVSWYKNPNNNFELPNFLRESSTNKLTKNKPTTFVSEYTLRNTSGSGSIDGSYSFMLKYGLQNSAFDGLNLTISVAAFQPTEGEYLISNIQKLADWLHSKGLKLGITLIDQTYLTESEIPDHMPHWKLRDDVNNPSLIRRSITYYTDVNFNVKNEIFSNPNWSTYNSSRSGEGTYRWFHHVWTLIDALKDKPALHIVSVGETSGSAIGVYDRLLSTPNSDGVFNSQGLYGVTFLEDNLERGELKGAYDRSKTYSFRKQRVALGKLFLMISDQLKNRPDVRKVCQTNYFRGGVSGNDSVNYSQSTFTFTSTIGQRFKNGDGIYVTPGAGNALLSIGLTNGTLYYVRNVSGNSYQLSLTPNGSILQFSGNIAGGSGYFQSMSTYIELSEEGFRTTSTHNGVELCGEAREMRLLVEQLHQFGFGISGPDIITTSLESPYYYSGPNQANIPSTAISPVEIILQALEGRGWFSDLGPLPGGRAIQGQDSTYQNKRSSYVDALFPMFGEEFEGRISLEQCYKYSLDRLKVDHVDLYISESYPEKPLPNLIEAVCKYKS